MCGNPQAISQFHNSPLKNIDVQIPHKMWIRLVLCDFSLELILMELLLSKHSYFIFLLLFVSEKVFKNCFVKYFYCPHMVTLTPKPSNTNT